MAALTLLRDRLGVVADQLRIGGTQPVDDLLETLEMMTVVEKHYTPEQLDWLARRREEVGEERIKQVEAEWPRLIDEVAAAIDAGVPASEAAAIARSRARSSGCGNRKATAWSSNTE